MPLYLFAIQIALSDQSGNYPALHLRHRTLSRRQVGFQERGKTAISVGTRQPGSDAISIVLVARAPKLRLHSAG